MSIFFVVWLASLIVALILLLTVARTRRFIRVGSEAAAAILAASFPFIFLIFDTLPLLAIAAIIHLWLLVLPARLAFGRLEVPFLMHSTAWNAMVGALLLACLAMLEVWMPTFLGSAALVGLLVAGLGVSFFLLSQLRWNTRHYRIPSTERGLPLGQLPTVSVCIPARNEDHALAECLAAVLASDYPKLEVLVLDDCSQDATSSIIKSFAHDGVRFIQGEVPAVGWLGKNQARQTLAEQASGDYVLFLDVDTHLAPHTIKDMVHYMLEEKQQMVAVLPQNRLGISTATLFGTLDYFWRMSSPITAHHLPASGNCWLITAAALQRLGGFRSVSRKIHAEESFALRLSAVSAYRFIVSDAALGVTTAKRWTSQLETTIRVRYPSLDRQPLFALGVCLGLLAWGTLPFVVLGVLLFTATFGFFWWLSLAAVAGLFVNAAVVMRRLLPRTWPLSVLCLPFIVLQETALVLVSMLQYEFGEVNWKGRNVCYPVLPTPSPTFARSSRPKHS